MVSDYFLMFTRWLARPLSIGTVVPSAGRLAEEMVRAATTAPPGVR